MPEDTAAPAVPSVPEGLFTQDQMDAAVAQAKAGIADLQLQVTELTKDRETIATAQQKAVQDRDAALAQLAKSADEVMDLKDDLVKAEAELRKALTAPSSAGLVLDGVPHQVVRQERMRDMAEAFKARFVDDDDTVLLVKKA